MPMTEKQAAAVAALEENLLTDAYLPVFRQKCAEAGLPLNSNEDIVAALETTAMLKAAEEEYATQPTGAVSALRNQLKQAMYGDDAPSAPESIKQSLEALKTAE